MLKKRKDLVKKHKITLITVFIALLALSFVFYYGLQKQEITSNTIFSQNTDNGVKTILTLDLAKGECLPANTIVKIDFYGSEKLTTLENLVKISGAKINEYYSRFYIESTDVNGIGDCFGSPGKAGYWYYIPGIIGSRFGEIYGFGERFLGEKYSVAFDLSSLNLNAPAGFWPLDITFSYGGKVYYRDYAVVNVPYSSQEKPTTTQPVQPISLGENQITMIPFTACSKLSNANEIYTLTSDIKDSSITVCIEVLADNITLDCGGHVIDGVGLDSTIGIYVESVNNFKIKNCYLTDWDTSIKNYNSDYTEIGNSSISGLSSAHVYLTGSGNFLAINTSLSKNLVYFNSSSTAKFRLGWYGDVYVEGNDSLPISGASVVCSTTNGFPACWSVFTATTNASGFIPRKELDTFCKNATTNIDSNPWNCSASKTGYLDNSTLYTINNNVLGKTFTVHLPKLLTSFLNVTLVNPPDETITNETHINFICTAADDKKVNNLSLYSNYSGTWENFLGIINNSCRTSCIINRSIDFGVDERKFSWNCLANDNESHSAWAQNNFTVIISRNQSDTTPPNLNFVSPTPASASSISYSYVTFNVSVVDTQTSIRSCNIYIDSASPVVMSMSGSGTSVYCSYRVFLSNGAHTFYVRAWDNANNENITETRIVTISDNSPPSENINIDIGKTTADIYVDFNEPANVTLNYGKTTSLGTKKTDSDFVLSHTFSLSGLDPDTLYYFNITACDQLSNCEESKHNFTTRSDQPGPDGDNCGDNYCGSNESQTTCCKDCGCSLGYICVDNICRINLGSSCSNGNCESNENPATCPQDCHAPNSCGNGVCDTGESYSTCQQDCFLCGDKLCDVSRGEDITKCSQDCLSVYCGNEKCDSELGESYTNCCKDCGCQGNMTCKKNNCVIVNKSNSLYIYLGIAIIVAALALIIFLRSKLVRQRSRRSFVKTLVTEDKAPSYRTFK